MKKKARNQKSCKKNQGKWKIGIISWENVARTFTMILSCLKNMKTKWRRKKFKRKRKKKKKVIMIAQKLFLMNYHLKINKWKSRKKFQMKKLFLIKKLMEKFKEKKVIIRRINQMTNKMNIKKMKKRKKKN